MTMHWFRLYHRIIDDEKLRLLAFEDRWHFVALCCLKGDGLLDEPDDSLRQRKIAVKLGVQVRELEEIGRRLQEVGLIDETLSPVAWDELQYRSDNSNERVKKYREKQKLAKVKRTGNVSVTAQELDTELDTDIDNKLSKRGRASIPLKPESVNQDVWDDFLAIRKAKRAPLTNTALDAIQREAAKAGWTLNEALSESVARGWQGFKADWVKETNNGKNTRTGGADRRSSLARAIDEGLDFLG